MKNSSDSKFPLITVVIGILVTLLSAIILFLLIEIDTSSYYMAAGFFILSELTLSATLYGLLVKKSVENGLFLKSAILTTDVIYIIVAFILLLLSGLASIKVLAVLEMLALMVYVAISLTFWASAHKIERDDKDAAERKPEDIKSHRGKY